MNQTLIILIALAIFCNFSYALECYECRSLKNGDCDDPINNNTISFRHCSKSRFIENNSNYKDYQCAKVIERNVHSNKTFVGRQCVAKKQDNFCERYRYYQAIYGFTVDSCYTCETNLCNSGEQISGKSIFGTILIAGILTKYVLL